jgi:hypothetical protein
MKGNPASFLKIYQQYAQEYFDKIVHFNKILNEHQELVDYA